MGYKKLHLFHGFRMFVPWPIGLEQRSCGRLSERLSERGSERGSEREAGRWSISESWGVYPLVNQHSYWKWLIYSGFTHWKWWFSIVMLVYQRVYPTASNSWMIFFYLVSMEHPMEKTWKKLDENWGYCHDLGKWQQGGTYSWSNKTYSGCHYNMIKYDQDFWTTIE